MALVLAVGLAAVGHVLLVRASVVAAADAAALAAAPVTFRSFGGRGTPEAEARHFADLNGAALVRCDCPIDRTYATRTVVVEVERRVAVVGIYDTTVRATSAAEFEPVQLLTGG